MSSDYREDTGTPMEVTLKEAAQLLGLRSRSSLYRLMEDRILSPSNYLRGRERAWRIELHPEGHRPFVEWGRIVIGPQGPRRQSELQPPPPEWADRFRVADPSEPPLSREEIWREVGRLMTVELCDWTPPEEPLHLETLIEVGKDCLELVEQGARWCPETWNRYETALHLGFASDADSREILRGMLAAGRVPADLVPTVEKALAEQEVQG